jgi:hypothetical protein
MVHLKAFVIGFGTLCLVACSEPTSGGSCFDGETGDCFCNGGGEGSRTCLANGFGDGTTWGECVCTGANNGTNNGANNGTNNGANNGTNNGANNGTNNGANNGTNNGANNGTNNGANNGTDPDAEPPVIDALDAVPQALVPGQTVTVTAEVSDPQGAHTVFGGTIVDSDAGATVGSFVLDSPGTWVVVFGWPELAAAEPVVFGSGEDATRHLQAVFQDLSGNEVSAALELTLRCENDLDAATGDGCAPPQGPEVTTFTVSMTEVRPGESIDVRAVVAPDPDNPNGTITAELQFNSRDAIGPLSEGPARVFTGSFTWEQLNRARPFDTTDLDRGDRRSIQVRARDDRGLSATASDTITGRCSDPLELPVGGECVGECGDDYDYCGRFGLYSPKCHDAADFCWWLADDSSPSRGTTCNSLCERIDLRCDEEVGFPEGYSGVRERCYGEPGCYAGDQRRFCTTPTRSGDYSRLACVCVR